MRVFSVLFLILCVSICCLGQGAAPFEGNGIFDLIGKSTSSSSMQQLKQYLKQDPDTKFSETVWFSRKKGLEVGLKYGKVVRVFVHGESPYNYGTKPFSGLYPLGVNYTNSTQSVVSKLGEPAERKSWGALLYYVVHEGKTYYTSFEMNKDSQTVKYVFIKFADGDHSQTLAAKDFGGIGKSSKDNVSDGGGGSTTEISTTKKTGCIQGDCTNGTGTFLWESGSKFVGEYKAGQRNGFGTLYYDNGDIYIGEWKKNQQYGNGVYQYSTKGSYKLYSGDWVAGKRSGFGYMQYKNGTQRIGFWVDGKFEKTEKTGCVSGDCQSQKSEYIWEDDGSRFIGEYAHGKRNGTGTYFYGKGGKYHGTFKDGKRDGKGTYYFPNGSKYVGTWRNDLREGYGTLYKKGGKVVKGTWKAGKLVSKN